MNDERTIEALFRAFLRGEERELEELHFYAYNRLFRYGLTIVGRTTPVHDAIQDLFVYIWEKKSMLCNVASAEVYLLRALRLRLLEARRREMRRRARAWRFLWRLGEPAAYPPDYEVEENSGKMTGRVKKLREELGALSPRQREVIHLRYYDNLDYGEIAVILGVSHQVARNYGYRGLEKLRKQLKGPNPKRDSISSL